MKNLLVLIVKKRDKAQKLLRKNLKISIVLLALAGGILIRLLREDNEVLRFYAPHGTVFIELARTEQERELGLMNRQSLGSEDGMLFVFDENDAGCFWMKNTYIPLDMIFISKKYSRV